MGKLPIIINWHLIMDKLLLGCQLPIHFFSFCIKLKTTNKSILHNARANQTIRDGHNQLLINNFYQNLDTFYVRVAIL